MRTRVPPPPGMMYDVYYQCEGCSNVFHANNIKCYGSGYMFCSQCHYKDMEEWREKTFSFSGIVKGVIGSFFD